METRSKHNPKFKRLHPGYYFTPETTTIQGVEVAIVIEGSGTRWALRIDGLPGWETYHGTKRMCKLALESLLAGSLEYCGAIA